MYDFGEHKNLKHYGTKTPPQYRLSNVNVPTHLFYALNDRFSQKAVSLKNLSLFSITQIVPECEKIISCFKQHSKKHAKC